jgi:hypothetical protein
MTSTSDTQAPITDFAPRHFYYSRYLCVTNLLLCGLMMYGAVSGKPVAALVALPFVAWSYVCLRELIQRKPAITVSAEGIVIRKLIFADAHMPFDDIEEITKTQFFGGNLLKFHRKSVGTSFPYQILIYKNQHLNCSVEATEVVAAIKAARPGINLQEA